MKNKSTTLPLLYPHAAGIDISSKEHFVAVNPQSDEQPIRSFGTFTEDLHALCDWLKKCQVTTVAMEATGIYWVSLFLILESAGFEVVLVNARHVKNVRGKKSDVSDAEWIRQLHSYGLLSASFQPDAFTRTLRSYVRHKKNLIEMSATHILMMQKALEQMNIKLHHVISDITGKTGRAIISAILAGERNAARLAELADGRIKASREEMTKSLEGIWKEEHLFELRQSHDLYETYRRSIEQCEQRIEELIRRRAEQQSPVPCPPPTQQVPKRPKTKTASNAQQTLQRLVGTDLSEIFGISVDSAIELISEKGLDMSKWPTVKHFTAWLNLAPNNKISGGKVLSSRISKKKNRAGQVFKMAAYAVQRSKNWLAMFYHRIKAKGGAAKAITATARKIAVIYYKMVRQKVAFEPIKLETYTNGFKDKQLKKLQKQAQAMGLQLKPLLVT